MILLQRILITALAFVVGIALMPLAPFLMAWLFWGRAVLAAMCKLKKGTTKCS